MPVPSPDLHQASLGGDAQSDGGLFGIKTTGVYCTPSCLAEKPAPENVVYFESPAEARAAGYESCRRCKPDAAKEARSVSPAATVARALRLIEDGVLDRANIDALCERVGVGARQLRRLFRQHLGTSPVRIATKRRAEFARRLIETTSLSMTEVAEAAGFGSIRRFNAVMTDAYGCTPSELRKGFGETSPSLELELLVEPPFDWDSLLRAVRPSLTPGLERISGRRYSRVARFGQACGELHVSYDEERGALCVEVSTSLSRHLIDVVAGVRRIFDIDADVATIAEQLRRDPLLERKMDDVPLRILGAFDHFETAVAILLEDCSDARESCELRAEVVARYGTTVETSTEGLTHVFPTPYALKNARLECLGVPKRRSRCIQAFAAAVHEGELRLDGAPSLDEALQQLRAIPAMSGATAEKIAMRVYREPDAFPSCDDALRRAVLIEGRPATTTELEVRAEMWRPWRAYAATCLLRSREEATCRTGSFQVASAKPKRDQSSGYAA